MSDDFQLEARFSSYTHILSSLQCYCKITNVKYIKKHVEILDEDLCKQLTAQQQNQLRYKEIILGCDSAIPMMGKIVKACPSFFHFKLVEPELQFKLVEMERNHNHQTDILNKRFLDDYPEPLYKTLKTNTSEIRKVYLRGDNEINRTSFTFRGLIAPTLTPYDTQMKLDLNPIPTYAQFLNDSGIEGVLVNGTSGEGPSLSVAERKCVTEAWKEAVKTTQQHLMVQIGGAPLPDVLELAKHAESIGVDSLLCLPDLYFKPKTATELIDYLAVVGKEAPNTPLLYYHIPMFTNVNIHMGDFLNQIGNKVPNFHGIKFTSNLLDEGIAAVKAHNGAFAVFLGADQLMAGAYALGFDSAIATSLNMFPKLGIKILRAVKESKIEEARIHQNTLTAICDIVTKHGTWVPSMKTAMDLVSPIRVGPARSPLQNLTSGQIKEMEMDLRQFKNMI